MIERLSTLFMTPPQRMKAEIRRLQAQAEEKPLPKEQYLPLYHTYQALSPADKQRVLPTLTQLRERMGAQLLAEKGMEALLQSSPKTLKQQHQRYTLFHAHFTTLSKSKQREYYPTLIHLRWELERGR